MKIDLFIIFMHFFLYTISSIRLYKKLFSAIWHDEWLIWISKMNSKKMVQVWILGKYGPTKPLLWPPKIQMIFVCFWRIFKLPTNRRGWLEFKKDITICCRYSMHYKGGLVYCFVYHLPFWKKKTLQSIKSKVTSLHLLERRTIWYDIYNTNVSDGALYSRPMKKSLPTLNST